MSHGRDDSEDFFSETRMSFGDHLEELRWHLWRAVIGFVLILTLVFVFDFVGYLTETHFGIGRPIMDLITKPVEDALVDYYDQRAERVNQQADANEGTLPPNITQPQEMDIEVNTEELAEATARRLGLKLPEKGENEPEFTTLRAKVKPYKVVKTILPALQKMG